ncbi:MAG: antitoxin MazE [Clostridiales bacterium]|jgi:antitoxin MazE|nr:antitoxin MazE [Clostridiales bacterium]MDN5298206.1 antitoxin MazE [Clostridiales bacterium]
MSIIIKKMGNSKGIILKKDILEALNLCENDELNVEIEEDKLILSKVKKTMSIDTLFSDYTGNYKPTEIDWGKSLGREIW